MNLKINRMWLETTGTHFDDVPYNVTKFAESIVRECASIARTQSLQSSGLINSEYQGEVIIENKILEHFNINI
jgi:hypothetical protein